MKTTGATLNLLAALGRLEFNRMTDSDRQGFDGAADDAEIATTGTEELTACLGAIMNTPLEYPVMAIASDARIEIHGVKNDGEPFCYGFDVQDLF